MDNPTKVLTIGIGALAAVAAYLGLQNTEETPEIIDSDIHDYDSKAKLEQEKKLEEEKRLEEKRLEEVRLEEVRLEEVRLEEVRLEEVRLEEEKKEGLRLKKEAISKGENSKEEKAVEENVKIEVKEHMDKLPYKSPWGTFWKSEYDDITKEETTN